MSLTREDVKKVAGLSRLRMNDQQLDKIAPELNKILGFIEQLDEVNTDNVEPLSNVARSTLPLRADVVNDGECADKVLANAPEAEENYFAVPKVVE
jgi:aspartyl-tRNA(Asn)/glutamyl-tRNA(Gln) amidotransferase subunit C